MQGAGARAGSFLLSPLCAAALLLAVTASAAGPGPASSDSAEMTSDNVCRQIQAQLQKLAEAERAQAFALDLYSHGNADTAIVQGRLQGLVEQSIRLRETLKQAVTAAPPGDDTHAQCMSDGYRSLREAEQISSSVEGLLLQARGSLPPS